MDTPDPIPNVKHLWEINASTLGKDMTDLCWWCVCVGGSQEFQTTQDKYFQLLATGQFFSVTDRIVVTLEKSERG